MELHQPFGVAPGQQIHGLLADAQGHVQQFGAVALRHSLLALRVQLQAQAFRQVACAHPHRLQGMQQVQGNLKVVQQLFGLLGILGVQAGGEYFQWVFQIAVVGQGFDQKAQRGAVFGSQAQAEYLVLQKGLQAFLAAAAFAGILLFVVCQVVGAGRGIYAPFAIVRRQFNTAIAVPVAAIVGGQRALVFVAVAIDIAGAGAAQVWLHGGELEFPVANAHRRVGLRQAEFFALAVLFAAFQKRVFIQHLLHLLAEF